jgi:esterase/lipase superfamily enzyme
MEYIMKYILYYATNRDAIEKNGIIQAYGKGFSRGKREDLQFGTVSITVNENEVKKYLDEEIENGGKGNGNGLAGYFSGLVEKKTTIDVFEESIDHTKPDERQSKKAFGSKKFFDDLKKEMMSCTDTLVYIHGYSVSWINAVGSAFALQEMLNKTTYGNTAQKVLVVLFTWPSDGSKFPFRAYYSDRHDAENSFYAIGRAMLKLRDYFVNLNIAAIEKKAVMCGQEIHLLCHSMGNYVLQNAIKYIEEYIHTPTLPKLFDNVFLCAADVDDDVLENGKPLGRLNELCGCVSVYYNKGDVALKLSDKTKGNPERLGANGAAHPHILHNKIHQIDCSEINIKGISEHSYYMDGSVNADIKQSIEGFTQDDARRNRITTNELPNIWKITNIKTREKMVKTFEEIRDCVRAKVRKFCSIEKEITDTQIGALTMEELHLTQNSHLPGISPADALASSLRKCVDINIELSGNKLIENPKWTVDKVAKFIFGQIQ